MEIEIENWQRKHERVYSNWIESDLFEKEAFKELTNYKKGKLNSEAEKIRKQLSEYFKLPVYLLYFDEGPDYKHHCLLCEQNGIESGLRNLNRICKTCNTIFHTN